ncbi:Quinol monooxygenase YgiN [Pustulibacterium marinum]|uniref:Quinol monooxygenase YgiN n=1 Tax=Pustulibacterium marinum TaxID=1224947 RepID=A0A1I7HHD9_9FLAO|nr:putative quinol monooxygenase [Pustulibacterium marinum]SFU60022.1 Quinol monooxygenase YgiN [Pustulibacterium marinum]
MLTVIAKIIAKKTKVAETKALLQSLVAPTLQEEGCIQYDLHQGSAEEQVFFFYENWEDRNALEKHLANTHLVAFKDKAQDLLEKPMEVFLLSKL